MRRRIVLDWAKIDRERAHWRKVVQVAEMFAQRRYVALPPEMPRWRLIRMERT